MPLHSWNSALQALAGAACPSPLSGPGVGQCCPHIPLGPWPLWLYNGRGGQHRPRLAGLAWVYDPCVNSARACRGEKAASHVVMVVDWVCSASERWKTVLTLISFSKMTVVSCGKPWRLRRNAQVTEFQDSVPELSQLNVFLFTLGPRNENSSRTGEEQPWSGPCARGPGSVIGFVH